ncbi:MAG: GNAT family N-acetyltransferase [Acidobacteriaceae bacterium]|nr:GNAT family N-acetyltransferase [Acidobacteriaceae bacterium]
MPKIRSYSEADWGAVLEICLLAFTPIHQSFERCLGTELFTLIYPDWKASNEKYLRALIESGERERLLVAEENGAVVAFIHYQLNSEKQCGEIGLNAVHPAHQGKGIGSSMYSHVLDLMRRQGMNYVQVGTGGDPSHVPARRAYEKVGFVPLAVVNYFRDLSIPDPIGRIATPTLQNGPRLIIVCGLPGSGKTSHAKEIEQTLRAVRFSADEWMDAMGINLWEGEARQRIEELQWKIAQQILSVGGTVIIEWGTWARSERDVLRTGARRLGAAVELHFLDAPVDVLFDRIHRRKMETPPITLEDIQRWAQIFERPSSEEMALFDAPLAQRHFEGSNGVA